MNIQEYQKLYKEFTSKAVASSLHLESAVTQSEKDLIAPLAKGARRIYDLGTGNGRIPKFLSELGIEASIYGIDSNFQMFFQASEFQNPHVNFIDSDILDWLKNADEGDLILCIGNTMGGFMDKEYRDSVFASIYEKLQKGGHFVVDYRPIEAVLKNDIIICRQPQNYGEIIITMEEINGEKMRLPQFYPDEELFRQKMMANGFAVSNPILLEGTKYVRKAIILEKGGVS